MLLVMGVFIRRNTIAPYELRVLEIGESYVIAERFSASRASAQTRKSGASRPFLRAG
jgi:hypothetical protein